MPNVDLQSLSDDARVWVFGISPKLDEAGTRTVQDAVAHFMSRWASHGEPIVGSARVIEGSFLLIAVTPESETSGCSIDRMFGTLRQLESTLGVEIIDSDRLFLRDSAGEITAVRRGEFHSVASAETRVFDTLAERLGDVRSGAWERPARDSWHRQLLGN